MKTTFILKAKSFGFTPHENNSLFFKGLITLPFLFFLFSAIKTNAQPPVPAYPSLTFNSPTLISGTDLQVDAVYNFPNVTAGVDAHVTIMGISGGAWLAEIDNTTGAGYYDAFQPYVGAGANDTSYIDWKFVFKKAGTDTDTILPVLAVTGVDVDGDASALKEFIQAATPGSFALDANTYLNFGFDGVRSTAISTVDNYPLIDTANTRSMFQMNFTNINTILYRNGAITTGGAQVRQTSIYFKSFFNFSTILPVQLLSFDAKAISNGTTINWTAVEEDLQYYTVQKSTDGKKWKDISKIYSGTRTGVNKYTITDLEKNNTTAYYRLQQMGDNNSATYSKIVALVIKDISFTQVTKVSTSGNKINLQINSKTQDDYVFDIYTMNGVKIVQAQNKLYSGANQYSLSLPNGAGKGIFLMVIKNKSGQPIYNQKIPVI